MTNKVYIIAEAGVNHNGSLQLAYELCNKAKDSGVDAVKFQTWVTERIICKDTKMADYQKENLGVDDSQFDMLKKLELTYEDFALIKEYCDKIGIEFLSTGDTEDDINYLVNLGMGKIKLGSGDITNIPFLRFIGGLKLPVIISTGMCNLSDVATAFDVLTEAGAKDITILHCTTNYPCPMDEVNLRAMQTMRDAFKCKVGYSDHTMGTEIPIAAVAMGAEIIEKHFTLDRNMEGPDHKASLEPQELKYMVDCIRNIEVALGDGIKKPNASEVKISKVVLKSIVAKAAIKKGDMLTSDNITIKRAGSGIPAAHWDLIVGTKALHDFDIDEPIRID